MMGFAEALEFWQENQQRILVLASLAIQWFLYFFARFRQHPIPGLLRLFIWLSYVGSDAVAIYALATLFNSHRCEHSSGRPVARLMWAPILLVHLSGQDSISAYNIEDNELWRRHVLTGASQVAAAIYVFIKLWPKFNVTTTHQVVDQATIDDRAKDKEEAKVWGIALAAVFLFFCGIIKYAFKIRDLKRVSVNSLVNSLERNGETMISSLQEYLGAATQYFEAETGHGRSLLQESSSGDDDDTCKLEEIWKPYNLCVDLAPPYSGRLSCLKHLVRNPDKAHHLVKSSLAATFRQLYTKIPLRLEESEFDSLWLNCHFWVNSLLITALMSYSFLSGTDQDLTDMIITYVLLGSALVMEALPTAFHETIGWIERRFTEHRAWPDQVAQYNMIRYVARSKKHSRFMNIAASLGCKDLVDQLWTMKPCKGASSQEITGLIHGHVAGGWRGGHIAGTDTFRAFNDYQGQWTLSREFAGVGRRIPSIVLTSVSRPFDESVLIWHLATDFCLHLVQEDASPSSAATRVLPPAARYCREMSNYMAYLLFVKPEMLMPGARRNLFRRVYYGLVNVLREDPLHEPRDLAHKVIQVLQRDGDRQHPGLRQQPRSIIRQAWSVAKDLRDSLRGDEEKMWKVIQGVWVEMLCFSASRCKGYLHAKSLGTGGEYLSYVWLLLLFMGMETLAEKMQRTELYEGHTAAGAAISSQNV